MSILNVVSDNAKIPETPRLREVPMFVCPDCKGKLDDLKCSSCGRHFGGKDALSVLITAASLSLRNNFFWYGMFIAFKVHRVGFCLISRSFSSRYTPGVFTGSTIHAALCSHVKEVLA